MAQRMSNGRGSRTTASAARNHGVQRPVRKMLAALDQIITAAEEAKHAKNEIIKEGVRHA